MNTKRILALILCAVMMLTMIPVMTLTASAAEVEGDWTTYRHAGDYYDPEDLEPGEEPPVYKPEAGYTYTDEGFTIVPASYKDTTPFMTAQTKEKQCAKDGIYVQFRIDDFSYDGGTGADEWICVSLSTGNKTCPGQTWNGGGWLSLIRGTGNGNCNILPHLTDPRTEDFGGTFKNIGSTSGTVPTDDQGREIYTFEVTWNGSEYEMKINGKVLPGGSQVTTLMEKVDANGDFYVGITLNTKVADGKAALTILKYGTSEADATTPVGSDSKEPEPNEMNIAEIADPSTVEPNMPALLWNTETYSIGSGNNCTFTVLGDNTWRVTPTDSAVYFFWSPKRYQSWAAEDFPVFAIMTRNITTDGGNLWYAAGEVMAPQNDCIQAYSIFDGELYEDAEGNEYAYILVDLTELWTGRIHNIRMDMAIEDFENGEFDICFAGMFRSYEEGVAYGESYLASIGIDPNATEPETEPATEPETAPEAAPETETAPVTTPVTQPAATEPTTEAPAEGGCASVVGFGAVAVLVAAAAGVALKKKD